MSYQVLARKWRPRNFQEMVGQEHILRMLTNALDSQRLHHAYLFTGTRGVGKTTLGRILAKCLNCETGITSNPCGTCNHCTTIDNGRFFDLIEVDAASRTKVEDTRELLDNIHYPPTQGRYKVYLIDEVHMLSNHSFNALLKTLEEPPPYVKFLLATTDPKRLPITILSRCLQFNLKRVPLKQMMQHLQHICVTETIPFEPPALELLTHAADGSMRDALSLLDQAIAFCSGNITTADTKHMLGTIEQDTLLRLLDALANQDGAALLNEIEHLGEMAIDFNQALEDLLSLFHHLSIAKLIPDAKKDHAMMQSFAERFSAEDIQLYYQIGIIGRRDLPFAPSMQQGFEMILMRMLAFRPAFDEATPTQTKATLATTATHSAPPIATAKPSPTTTSPTTTSPHGASTPDQWSEMLPHLGLSGMAYALAANCVLVSIKDDLVTLALSAKQEPMLNTKLTARMEEAFSRHLGKPIKLNIDITNTAIDTPTKQREQQQMAKQSAADAAVESDGDIKKIMGLFDATLTSVTPT